MQTKPKPKNLKTPIIYLKSRGRKEDKLLPLFIKQRK